MSEAKDLFADSAGYELSMGRCSRVAGKKFLDWLSLPDGLQWLDVGCGTGSFTELVLDRNAPNTHTAIDPAAEQIAFAPVQEPVKAGDKTAALKELAKIEGLYRDNDGERNKQAAITQIVVVLNRKDGSKTEEITVIEGSSTVVEEDLSLESNT